MSGDDNEELWEEFKNTRGTKPWDYQAQNIESISVSYCFEWIRKLPLIKEAHGTSWAIKQRLNQSSHRSS